MFVATNYHSEWTVFIYLFYFILFYGDSKSEKSFTCGVQFNGYTCTYISWKIWTLSYTGIRLMLHTKLPPTPNYFKIANQAFFKQSRILSFFWCLFWLFPPLAVVILLLAGQWAKNLEVATPIFQHPGTFWGGSPNEAKLLVRTQALRRGFTSAAVFLLLWALRWL